MEEEPETDISELIMEILFFDKIPYIFDPLPSADGIVELLKSVEKSKERVEEVRESMDEYELQNIKRVVKLYDDPDLIKLALNLKKYSRVTSKTIEKSLGSMYVTSKFKIAKEFGVDKRTLNKWLAEYFRNRFDGIRRIRLDDYLEIFFSFTLTEKEDNDFIGFKLSG